MPRTALAIVVITMVVGMTYGGEPGRLVQLPAPNPIPSFGDQLPLPTVTNANPDIAIRPGLPPVLSVDQFARTFQPNPGKYSVVLIHPKTGCPVTVCFELPCKCAKKVTASKHTLRIDYPGLFKDVVIRFRHDGTVSVKDA